MVIPTSFSSSFNALVRDAAIHTTVLLPYLVISFPLWSIYILTVQMSCPFLLSVTMNALMKNKIKFLTGSLAFLYHTVKIGIISNNRLFYLLHTQFHI